MRETAFAKINLALHVRRRRDDGYHELETLFAFVDRGDTLFAERAEQDCLHVGGEFAGSLQDRFDNLVMHALGKLPRADGLSLTLEKNLPVAAGLGGGSADAGAVFRVVRDLYGLPDDWRDRAKRLGADVPACVESRTCIGRGTGTDLARHDDSLAGMPVLLVNPRKPLSTGHVFAAWDGVDRGPLPDGTSRAIALEGRNDLEQPAVGIVPQIAEVIDALRNTEAWLVRMTGSGATCFALFDTETARDAAAAELRISHDTCWQMGGRLR